VAVFTPVSDDAAKALLRNFELGQFTGLTPIQGGIENTNYFLSTSTGEYVLTLFERLSAEQLPFYLNFTTHLAAFGLPVPGPKVSKEGRSLSTVCGKPAAIVSKLDGKPVLDPQAVHCASLGATLAKMHLAARSYEGKQENLRSLSWWQQVVPELLPFLNADLTALIKDELRFQESQAAAFLACPRAAVHADLFRDNAMFQGDALSGVFDFYFAGVDSFVFDLAVCLNDWCIVRPTGALKTLESEALLSAYEAVRPLSDAERALLPAALRAAAMRFWVSRLFDLHKPRTASLYTAHDPAHFERVLRSRRDS
jgi:homoserine kinase type II